MPCLSPRSLNRQMKYGADKKRRISTRTICRSPSAPGHRVEIRFFLVTNFLVVVVKPHIAINGNCFESNTILLQILELKLTIQKSVNADPSS